MGLHSWCAGRPVGLLVGAGAAGRDHALGPLDRDAFAGPDDLRVGLAGRLVARRGREGGRRRRGEGCSVRSGRSEEHTSELQSLMRISYAVFCLKKKKQNTTTSRNQTNLTN